MGEEDHLHSQLVNQLNMEYTLARIYKKKAEREADKDVKLFYIGR